MKRVHEQHNGLPKVAHCGLLKKLKRYMYYDVGKYSLILCFTLFILVITLLF